MPEVQESLLGHASPEAEGAMSTTYRSAASLTERDRFWLRVQPSTGCWLWIGPRTSSGYGAVRLLNRKMGLAHRLAWEYAHGPIPDGQVVCHHCDNPPCCNPSHLFVGTQADNLRDMTEKGRRRSNPPKGGNAGRAVLTPAQATDLLAGYVAGVSQKALAERFGVSKGTVYNVIHGTHWAVKEAG